VVLDIPNDHFTGVSRPIINTCVPRADCSSPLFVGNLALESDPESQVIGQRDQADVKTYDEKSTVLNEHCFDHGSISNADLW
jgi:hypothetical protein